MTSTTKGAARQGDAPLTTRPGKASQQFRNPATGRNTTIMTHHFEPVDGQYVSCMHRTWTVRRTGVVVAVVPPASAAGHDWTGYIVEYPPSPDEHPAVRALAIYDGMHRGLFRAEELQPVPADDAPPTTDADAVEHLTGATPTTDVFSCPRLGCDFVIGAAGPVDIDEDDPFQTEVDAHRRSHEPVDSASHRSSSQAGLASLPATTGASTAVVGTTPTTPDDPRDIVRGSIGEVSAVALLEAARGFPVIFDTLVPLVDLPRSDVAALLRRVADVIEEATR